MLTPRLPGANRAAPHLGRSADSHGASVTISPPHNRRPQVSQIHPAGAERVSCSVVVGSARQPGIGGGDVWKPESSLSGLWGSRDQAVAPDTRPDRTS